MDCKKALASGNAQQLEATARSWLRWQPQSGLAWLYLAEAAQRQGDLARTADCLGRLPESDPKLLAALAEKSMLEFGVLNRPWEGVRTCRRLLALEPQATVAHKRLIFFYAMTLQRRQMLAQIRQAVERGCEKREAYVYLMMADGLEFTNGPDWTSRWLAADADNEELQVAYAVHVAKLARARVLAELTEEHARRDEEARRRIGELLERFPRNVTLLDFLLEQAVEQADLERVGQLLVRATPNLGDEYSLWRFRGWYHAAVNEWQPADSAYRESLRLNPLSWQTRHLYAAYLRRVRRLAEAEVVQKLALEGKDIRKELMQLQNTEAVSDEMLLRIGRYAAACGDRQIADAIGRRFGVALTGPDPPDAAVAP